MMGIKSHQEKMFYNFSLNKKVPEDHFLRKLDQVIDLIFVRELVTKYYSHTGQPSIDPEVLFKMMLIGYFYNITSERRLAEEISLNLAYMWYIGYDLDETPPNHSVISKARARYGKEVFEKFFQEILRRCISAGLVKCDKVYVDSTIIEANASMKSIVPRAEVLEVKLSPKEYIEKVYAENDIEVVQDNPSKEKNPSDDPDIQPTVPVYEGKKRVETNSYRRKKHISNIDYVSKTDPECSIIGRFNARLRLGYKEHFSIDKKSRVITAVSISDGATDDGEMLKELIKKQPIKPKEVCGDSKYGTAENYHYAFKNGITPSISRFTRTPSMRRPNQWGREKFKYNNRKDVYICPNGKELRKIGFYKQSKQWMYSSGVTTCKTCRNRGRCLGPKSKLRNIARHIYQDSVIRALKHLETPYAQQTIRERKIYAEWAIAEAKTLHGLKRARHRGKWKVNIQALLTASIQNMKRLVKHYEGKLQPTSPPLDKIQDLFINVLKFLRIPVNLALNVT